MDLVIHVNSNRNKGYRKIIKEFDNSHQVDVSFFWTICYPHCHIEKSLQIFDNGYRINTLI